jgi:hypothetical protein
LGGAIQHTSTHTHVYVCFSFQTSLRKCNHKKIQALSPPGGSLLSLLYKSEIGAYPRHSSLQLYNVFVLFWGEINVKKTLSSP